MDFVEKLEILHDYANNIIAKYGVYLINHNINDENNEWEKRLANAIDLEQKIWMIKNEDEYNEIEKEFNRLKEELPNE